MIKWSLYPLRRDGLDAGQHCYGSSRLISTNPSQLGSSAEPIVPIEVKTPVVGSMVYVEAESEAKFAT
jgi:hypothetical protein